MLVLFLTMFQMSFGIQSNSSYPPNDQEFLERCDKKLELNKEYETTAVSIEKILCGTWELSSRNDYNGDWIEFLPEGKARWISFTESHEKESVIVGKYLVKDHLISVEIDKRRFEFVTDFYVLRSIKKRTKQKNYTKIIEIVFRCNEKSEFFGLMLRYEYK